MKKTIILLLLLTILASLLTACDFGSSDIPSGSEIKSGGSEALTVENCPDLEAILFSKEASADDFAIKYDGCYVEFEACIYKNEKSSSTLDRTITVTGEISAEGETSGWVIKIGDRTLQPDIDDSVVKGDLVLVKGKVDADWTDYYNCLYIETTSLRKVN